LAAWKWAITLAHGASRGVVRLVHHQKLKEIPWQQVQPPGYGLHAGNLHRMA
jgi:hypothetical protein